jgi:hypothetical protein
MDNIKVVSEYFTGTRDRAQNYSEQLRKFGFVES